MRRRDRSCFGQAAQIGRGIRPLQAGGVVPVAAHPALHSNYAQLGVNVVLGVEHLRQFTKVMPCGLGLDRSW
jgi:hypothetical protein